MIRPFLQAVLVTDISNFIAPSAEVIGDVTLGRGASVWFNATVRADVNRIRIGAETNVQDNAVVHVTKGTAPTDIGAGVTIGHSAVVHGCTIEDNVLIGMGAVLLDHCVIGRDSIVGARALVTQGTKIPPRSLVLGVPARVVRELTDEEVARIGEYAKNYLEYSAIYRAEVQPERNPFY
ncbi:gamma carbonic anhydrase family protein [Rhodocaloribacter sp.]